MNPFKNRQINKLVAVGKTAQTMVITASAKCVAKITFLLPKLSARIPHRKQLEIPPIINDMFRIPTSNELRPSSHWAAGKTYDGRPFWKPMHMMDKAQTARSS